MEFDQLFQTKSGWKLSLYLREYVSEARMAAARRRGSLAMLVLAAAGARPWRQMLAGRARAGD